MYSNMVRRYVSYHFSAPGTPSRGGPQAKAAKNKHKVYFFFNAIKNGKRLNSLTGNSAFMTTPNIFYGNALLANVINSSIPTEPRPRGNLTANQRRNIRQRLINTVGGNAGIAKVLINNGLNARSRELPFIKNYTSRVTHKREIAKYRAWESILGHVAHRPTRNATGLQNRRTFNNNFKLNVNLYNKIKTHAQTAAGQKNSTIGPVKERQRQLFRLGAQLRALINAKSRLNRRTPGTPAYRTALYNTLHQATRANITLRLVHGPKFNSSRR